MVKGIIGAIIGILIAYCLGSLVGATFDVTQWHWILRLFTATCMFVVGCFGYVLGDGS